VFGWIVMAAHDGVGHFTHCSATSYQFTHDRFGRRKVLVERSARHLRRADDVVDRRRRVRFSTSNRNALLSNSERMRWRRLAATR
jgi:hypothetical protein